MARIEIYSRKNFPLIIIVAFVVAIALVFLFEDPLVQLRLFFFEQNFLWSSLVYFIVLSVSVVISPLTISPAVPFIAKVLGPGVTFILTVGGWFLGSIVSFLLARRGGDKWIEKVYPVSVLKKNALQIPKQARFFTLLQMRLYSPTDAFSYFLGSRSNAPFPTFALITLAGSIPAAFIFSYSADAIVSGSKGVLFSLFFAVLLIFIAYVFQKGWLLLETPARVVTRRGSFRAGEVFAVAALLIFLEKRSKKYSLERKEDMTKTIEKIEKGKRGEEYYLIDMESPYDDPLNMFGKAREPGVRGNNIPYGVFGLVWKKFGTTIAESEIVAGKCEEQIVWGIDAEEAGIKQELAAGVFIEQWSISEVLEKNYFPGVGVPVEEEEKRFIEAVNFAKEFLERGIASHATAKPPEDNSTKKLFK